MTVLVLAALSNPALAAAGAHGTIVFQTFGTFHSEKPDAIGPTLRGVYGRKTASLEDFRYSNAMMRANIVWDEASLREYIKDPQAKVPDTRMRLGGLNSHTDIDDVSAYLKDYK